MIDESKEFSAHSLRFEVLTILALPKNHPLRNVVYAHQLLLKHLEQCRKEANIDGQVLAIKDLLLYKLEPLEKSLNLIDLGMELSNHLSDYYIRRNFLVASMGYYGWLAIEERDKKNTKSMHRWIQKANKIAEEIKPEESQPSDVTMAWNWLLVGLIQAIDDKPLKAADIFTRIIDSTDPHTEVSILASQHEARLRIHLGHYDRAIEVLSLFVPIYEERYLTSVEDTAVRLAGENFSELINDLAFAYSCLGYWDLAIKSLERGKSLRLRYQTTLRQSSDGLRILELEKALYSLSRGVPLTSKNFTKAGIRRPKDSVSSFPEIISRATIKRRSPSSKRLVTFFPAIQE